MIVYDRLSMIRARSARICGTARFSFDCFHGLRVLFDGPRGERKDLRNGQNARQLAALLLRPASAIKQASARSTDRRSACAA
jgi:hypothetical protein